MPKLPVTVDLHAYRGDTWRQTFRLMKDDAPVDLSDLTIESWAQHQTTSAVSVLDVVIEPDPGFFTIVLPDDIHSGSHKYDVQITEANGDVKTWIKGDLAVERDVTHANGR